MGDSLNGYTYNFDIYIGKVDGQVIGPNGPAYDVVMSLFCLMQPLLNQGYHLYFNNFYSSDSTQGPVSAGDTCLCDCQ